MVQNMWGGGKVVEGAQYVEGKVVEGAQYVEGKIVEGAQYVEGKVVEGALRVENWVEDNVGITNVFVEKDEVYGWLWGTYFLKTATVSDSKLININFKNGIFQSVSLNFSWQLENISSKWSISYSSLGLQSTGSLNWENNGTLYTIKSTSNNFGGSIEWGKGNNGTVLGGGFRVNFDPFERFDFYNFKEWYEGIILHRIESGVYINSAIVELEVVLAIIVPEVVPILAKEIYAIAQAILGSAAASLSFLLYGEINKNSCDMEEC